MNLVDLPFAQTFDFTRRRPAACLGPDGQEVTLGRDLPRFDHDAAGVPRGLRVDGRPSTWWPDLLKVKAGDWAQPRGTVLHAYETFAGERVNSAWYAPTDPKAAVDACLKRAGRHRRIAYVPTFLRNRGGFVRWRQTDWRLGGLVSPDDGAVLAVDDDLILLEG